MRKLSVGSVAGLSGIAAGFLLAAEADTLRITYQANRDKAAIALGLKKEEVPRPRFRLRTETERKMTVPARPCPSATEALVIVAGGQSNAANYVPTPYAASPAVSVWYDGKCYPAADPLPGSAGDAGSLWSLLGDDLARRTGRPVMLIVGAMGGSLFREWNDPRTGLYPVLQRRMATAAAAGYRPHLILWHQGESDAGRAFDPGALRIEMAELTRRLLNDAPDARLYLFQVSRCTGQSNINGMPAAIDVFRSVAAADPRIVLGMNTDALGREYRWDQCHFNAKGREAIVAAVVPQLLPLLQKKPA